MLKPVQHLPASPFGVEVKKLKKLDFDGKAG
jgi:hypothetical protein